MLRARTSASSDVPNGEGNDPGFISPGYLFLLSFAFCSFVALVVQKLLLPMMPDLHGGHGLIAGDSVVFHNAAWEIALEVRANGWQEWALFPPGFTGNVGLLSALYVFFGPEPAAFILFNVAAHATGAVTLYLIAKLLVPGRAGAVGGLVGATLFTCFPSALLWYSQVHKDSFAIAGTLLMLYVWLRFQKRPVNLKQSLKLTLMVLLGALLVITVRPYLMAVVASGFVASYVLSLAGQILVKPKSIKLATEFGLLLFLVIQICGAAFSARLPSAASTFEVRSTPIQNEWKWEDTRFVPQWIEAPLEKVSVLRLNYLDYNRSVEAQTTIDSDRAPSDSIALLKYLPRALYIGCFAPFPETWGQKMALPQLAVAGETFIWYLFFPGILLIAYFCPGRALFSGIIFSIALITIYSYTTPNVGTLYRVRYGFWMFLLLCGSLGWAVFILKFLARAAEFSGKSAKKDAVVGDLSELRDTSSFSSVAAAGAVTLFITLCGFLCFLVRDLLLIHSAGITERMDVFFSAMMLPMVFVNCLALPMGDTVTRPFVRAYQSNGKKAASEMIRQFLGMGGLLMGCAAVFVFLFANLLVRSVLGDETPESIATGTLYLRLFTPIVFLSAWTVLGNCVLNGLYQHRHAALAGLVVPFCAIASILIVNGQAVLLAGIVGMLAGTLVNAVIVIILCRRNGITLLPSFPPGPAVYSEVKPYGWLVAAAVFTAIVVPVNFAFAGSVGPGALSAWAFANKITTLFTSLFAVSVTAVVLPYLARKFHYEPKDSTRDQFYFLVVVGTWVGIFLSVAISIFAEPVVYALFKEGAISDSQIKDLGNVIRIGAMQIPVAIAGAILIKLIAVSGATVTTLIATFLGLVGNIAVNVILVPGMGIEGVAVGALVFITIATFSLAVALRRKSGTSLRFSFVLLFGWIVCGTVTELIGQRSVSGILVALLLLCSLGALHYYSWVRGIHHLSTVQENSEE